MMTSNTLAAYLASISPDTATPTTVASHQYPQPQYPQHQHRHHHQQQQHPPAAAVFPTVGLGNSCEQRVSPFIVAQSMLAPTLPQGANFRKTNRRHTDTTMHRLASQLKYQSTLLENNMMISPLSAPVIRIPQENPQGGEGITMGFSAPAPTPAAPTPVPDMSSVPLEGHLPKTMSPVVPTTATMLHPAALASMLASSASHSAANYHHSASASVPHPSHVPGKPFVNKPGSQDLYMRAQKTHPKQPRFQKPQQQQQQQPVQHTTFPWNDSLSKQGPRCVELSSDQPERGMLLTSVHQPLQLVLTRAPSEVGSSVKSAGDASLAAPASKLEPGMEWRSNSTSTSSFDSRSNSMESNVQTMYPSSLLPRHLTETLGDDLAESRKASTTSTQGGGAVFSSGSSSSSKNSCISTPFGIRSPHLTPQQPYQRQYSFTSEGSSADPMDNSSLGGCSDVTSSKLRTYLRSLEHHPKVPGAAECTDTRSSSLATTTMGGLSDSATHVPSPQLTFSPPYASRLSLDDEIHERLDATDRRRSSVLTVSSHSSGGYPNASSVGSGAEKVALNLPPELQKYMVPITLVPGASGNYVLQRHAGLPTGAPTAAGSTLPETANASGYVLFAVPVSAIQQGSLFAPTEPTTMSTTTLLTTTLTTTTLTPAVTTTSVATTLPFAFPAQEASPPVETTTTSIPSSVTAAPVDAPSSSILPTTAAAVADSAAKKKEICGERCLHRKFWRRLRAKRGTAFFVCQQCGAKWKSRSVDEDEAAAAATLDSTPSVVSSGTGATTTEEVSSSEATSATSHATDEQLQQQQTSPTTAASDYSPTTTVAQPLPETCCSPAVEDVVTSPAITSNKEGVDFPHQLHPHSESEQCRCNDLPLEQTTEELSCSKGEDDVLQAL